MSASPTPANTLASPDSAALGPRSVARATRSERDERIFAALPELGSPAYLFLLKTATAAELPPPVLVRAYRSLGATSDAGRATLDRLVGRHDQYGYLKVLYARAERRKSRLGG